MSSSADEYLLVPEDWNPESVFIATVVEKVPYILAAYISGAIIGGIMWIIYRTARRTMRWRKRTYTINPCN